jgi:hypothetical protein
MLDSTNIALFLAAALVIAITPGPGIFYVAARMRARSAKGESGFASERALNLKRARFPGGWRPLSLKARAAAGAKGSPRRSAPGLAGCLTSRPEPSACRPW